MNHSDVLAGERLAHHRIADPVHLRQREQHQPERDAADRRPRPLRAALPQLVGESSSQYRNVLKPTPISPASDREHGHSR